MELDNIMKIFSFKGNKCFIIFLLLLVAFFYALHRTDFQDALEERLLLESVAWPETSELPSPLSLELTSHPAHSSFTILPARGGGQWHVGDQLEVRIVISDFKGQPKKSGGDLLLARLHNLTLGAGVAGQVVDHLNGSYSAVFPLLWEGAAQVEPICDFTDPRTGDPWFCYKPKNMSCDARITHSREDTNKTSRPRRISSFKVRIPASGPAGVTVLPKMEGQPEVKSSIVNFQASGYYYKGLWRALDGTKVHQFTGASAITQCLKGKVVHLYGDSTIRQWFEFLNAALPDLKEFNLGSSRQNGPFMALDYENKIMVTFRCHGPPLRFGNVPIEEIRYIANELDDLIGGPNIVVVFGIWSHLGTFPLEVYIRRLQRIRNAVVRLLDRAPKTVIIIRTANPKALWLYETITNSDWFSVRRSGHSVRLELDNIMKIFSFKGNKCFTIFLLLLVAFFYALHRTDFQDALEERLLLESVAWPETSELPSPLSLELTSHPAHSSFTILPARGGGQWHVGDQLEVRIVISDFKGQPKKSGGDLLLARLHNLTLGAGVAGQVVDHLNGSYSAVFPLLWEGAAQVEVMLNYLFLCDFAPPILHFQQNSGFLPNQVTLVHPSEAITVLNRLNREQPDRIFFSSLFRSGSHSQTTICNICLRQTQQPICDFTDPRTGDPWFCYKPKNMSCDARITHSMGGYKQNLKAKEDKLFQGGVNLKVRIPASGPAGVTVLPKMEGQPEVKSSIVNFQASGYYYQGLWRALDGTKVHQFTGASAITQCLKGKVVHLYGDSTIRQWFEFLNAALPDLKEFNLGSSRQNGPFMALDYENKIMVTFRCHGPPLRFGNVPIEEIRYIANELDDLIGGPNIVVVFGIWSHLGTFPLEVYIRRLQRIRNAVVRLLDRAPKTVIIIRTANPKALWLYETITNSDWFSVRRDKVLRAIFKGLNVHLIDAWEMVLAHHLPNSLHPQPPIIKNMMDVLFSYTCPQKGG
ncbi:hypothetical protein F7725_021792 [Dissostichus mawsoni]|uniref:NXPE C-terminal domain-containing protein n=1 Tax=Dissostichus mawsoni TaxID=36200 RepID=A0A7J5ZCV1_DISMA|nr:hypothetical protein F7725_021792 [Dissostichus mawsoni]